MCTSTTPEACVWNRNPGAAFSSANGRIECVDSRITVFKGTEKTQETVQPWKIAWMWKFPQTVYAPEPPQSLYWEEYREVWMNARYPDLFAESMRADGAFAEDNAIMLMERFTKDPTGFIRVLAATPVTRMSWFVYVIRVGTEEPRPERQSEIRNHVMEGGRRRRSGAGSRRSAGR